ncbi:DUF4190 domain-containing protein [Agrococcus baldri]|uniref:DUF4190 domain-containing protein n=1 Tax=Agrococcus baldri TaxID=153730 RepID=A0AA87URX5_9MICO|nr:DUF4190 domain-containing protein [Agrococcus baldri]GEK79860.1 hypothetical protein ABA31_12110 [Agrococcus baldri]
MSATAWPQQQGWSAPPAQPAWRAPTHPGPATNLMALLAIGAAALGTTVFLGLGSIAAVVLGFIALAQIRRTGDDGRLLAIWAIVLGGVTLLALIVGAVIGIGAIVAFSQQLATTPGF